MTIKITLSILVLISLFFALTEAGVTYSAWVKCGSGFQSQYGMLSVSLPDAQGYLDQTDENNPIYQYNIKKGNTFGFWFEQSRVHEAPYIDHVDVTFFDSNENSNALIEIDNIMIDGPDYNNPEQITSQKFCSSSKLYHGYINDLTFFSLKNH